jgi:hypothetical protein
MPHGLMVDTRESTPVLLVADRANRRIQRFTLEGKYSDFVEGTQLPCHFREQNGVVVVPDLFARVTLMDKSDKVITLATASTPIRNGASSGQRNERTSPPEVSRAVQRHLRSRGEHCRGGVGGSGTVTKLRKVSQPRE